MAARTSSEPATLSPDLPRAIPRPRHSAWPTRASAQHARTGHGAQDPPRPAGPPSAPSVTSYDQVRRRGSRSDWVRFSSWTWRRRSRRSSVSRCGTSRRGRVDRLPPGKRRVRRGAGPHAGAPAARRVVTAARRAGSAIGVVNPRRAGSPGRCGRRRERAPRAAGPVPGARQPVMIAGSLTPGRPFSTWPANRRRKAGSVSDTTVRSYQRLPARRSTGFRTVAPARTV